jgi:restriction system protein
VHYLDPQEATLAIMVNGVDATLGADHSGDVELTSSALGKSMIAEMQQLGAEVERRSPWSTSEFMYQDVANLEDLFRSEHLKVEQGTFLDQRFIDYLERNFSEIDKMHWRQFENLKAEYFTREGWNVVLGPGRADGGVDARVFSPEDPLVILVQCKRQQETVGKTVVKALHVDVAYEGARGGLVVTTNRLSLGARSVIRARKYPIEEADRERVREWLTAMRTPDAGAFLAE